MESNGHGFALIILVLGKVVFKCMAACFCFFETETS